MSSTEFNFTDEEFLTVINLMCKMDMPAGKEFIPVAHMEELLNAERLDSLGIVVFFIWISELFGIPEADVAEFAQIEELTPRAIKDFVIANCTQTYAYADAEEFAKKCL